LRPDQTQAAGDLLAQAFADDPLTVYTIPDPLRRRRVLAWAHTRWCAFLISIGHLFTTDNLEGIAGWFPPDSDHDIGLWTFMRAGLATAPLRFGLRNVRRVLRTNADVQRHYRKEIAGPHWILDVLGVDPRYQGRGVASALLEHTLAQTDQAHVPSYVITHNLHNVAFYERFGFQLLSSTPLGEGVFTTSLRRPAR